VGGASDGAWARLTRQCDVCYSFAYRRMHSAIDLLLGYFVARELGVAHTIFRDFQWSVGAISQRR